MRSEGPIRAGGAASKMSPSIAIGKRPHLLATWTSLWGCWSVLTIGQLTSLRASDLRQRKKKAANAFYEPTFEAKQSLLP